MLAYEDVVMTPDTALSATPGRGPDHDAQPVHPGQRHPPVADVGW